jgi:hypothetical protein
LEEIVDIQIEAYNSRNIELFCSVFAKDIKIFNHPNVLFIEGIESLKELFSNRFQVSPNVHCEIVNRIVLDNKVIDHEFVTGIFDDPIELIVMHTINNNKITRVDYLVKSGYPKTS